MKKATHSPAQKKHVKSLVRQKKHIDSDKNRLLAREKAIDAELRGLHYDENKADSYQKKNAAELRAAKRDEVRGKKKRK